MKLVIYVVDDIQRDRDLFIAGSSNLCCIYASICLLYADYYSHRTGSQDLIYFCLLLYS